MTTFVVILALCWVLFNVAASYAPLVLAERISPGRLPAELLKRDEARNVRFYVGRNSVSYAFSIWAPPLWSVVVFDKKFFERASPELVRFVVAHELGHAAARHYVWRWFAIVTGVALFPFVRRWIEKQEETADAYATQLTGLKKEFFEQLK